MIHLIILLIVFFLFGIKNGSYYGRKEHITMTTIELSWFLLMFYTGYFIDNTLTEFIVQLIFTITLFYQAYVFHNDYSKQIHSTEYLLGFTTRIGFVMSGADIIMLFASSWIADTLFKMPINYYIGRKLIEKVDGTDDPTGKSVGTFTPKWLRKIFPFLKEFYAVPRLLHNGYHKLYAGILSLLIWGVLYYIYNIKFNIQNIINLFN